MDGHYDGEDFVTFTTADGLVGNRVYAILADRQGLLWFGTDQGLSRYDGEGFVTYTQADGLTHSPVRCLLGPAGAFAQQPTVSVFAIRIA